MKRKRSDPGGLGPAELRAIRESFGLTPDKFAALGERFGGRLSAHGRTVRRWEDGSLDIPLPVIVMVRLMEGYPTVRRAFGLPEPGRGDGATG